MDLYLRHCGSARRVELGHQVLVMTKLDLVARQVASPLLDTHHARAAALRELLLTIELPTSFQLPLHSNQRVQGLVISKCFVLESKKKPLLLTFKNAVWNGPDVVVMYKVMDN